MPPERAFDDTAQDVHRIVACASRPSTSGASTTTASGARPTRPRRGSRSPACRCPTSLHRRRRPERSGTRVRAGRGRPASRTGRRGTLCAAHRRRRRHLHRAARGLPQAHCYDLVYRHGLDVGADGRTLLMGSTTGSLWASDERRERWQGCRPRCRRSTRSCSNARRPGAATRGAHRRRRARGGQPESGAAAPDRRRRAPARRREAWSPSACGWSAISSTSPARTR